MKWGGWGWFASWEIISFKIEVFTATIYFLYCDLLRLHQYSGQALRQTCSTLGSWDNIGILCQDQWLLLTFSVHKSNSLKLRSFPAGEATISKWQRLLSLHCSFYQPYWFYSLSKLFNFSLKIFNSTSHIFHKN